MDKRILVIDDDADCLEIIREILVYAGFCVDGFTATDSIIPMLTKYKSDLLILDYKLIGKDGRAAKTGGELCREVKSCALTAGLPVILASVYPDVLKSIDRFNCDAFVAKPFDMYALIAKATELLDWNSL